ncbi:MAG TPA: hypothetical protein VK929_05560 [Longimicrobiales bacterium]|nr:hypothetical protein [Longimicrobiales bacterium]
MSPLRPSTPSSSGLATLLALLALPVLVLLCLPAGASGQAVGDEALPVLPADAYADALARDLVRQARIRRTVVDRRIEAYETTVTERISAGLGLGFGERLLYRRETASRVSWTPDTVRIDVLGAREVLPPVNAGIQVPSGLAGSMPSMVFDPVDSEMLLRLENTSLRHPLATGSEAHYRFAAGDSTLIRLPDGRSVHLRELRITPRRPDPDLIAGSFWLDMETHAVVQAYFRLARGLDSRRDDWDVPLVTARAELDYIAIDYGLWELRWWLPRSVAARGVFQLGRVRMPLNFERSYADYDVRGAFVDLATLPEQPGEIPPRPCRPRVSMQVQANVGRADTAAIRSAGRVDTLQAVRVRTAEERRAAREGAVVEPDSADDGCDRVFIVTQPSEDSLLDSRYLPGDIYAGTSPVLPPGELEALAERVRRIPQAPWHLARPRVSFGVRDGLTRYNRVEGLSIGVRPRLDLGRAAVDGEFRVGTASGEVGAGLGLTLRGARVESRVGGYRRLDVSDPARDPFGLANSFSAFVLGRDEADYFRATGAELAFRPADVHPQWWDVRLFAERQQAVATEIDFHVRRLADDQRTFRPNPPADAADQAGATLRLRAAGQGSVAAPRWAAELELHGETGDFTFARPLLRVRTALPLAARWSAGVEAAAGTTVGDAPLQRAWRVGGAPTIRGHDYGAASGEMFWTGRLELGRGLPFARLVVFGDVGWAGDTGDLWSARPLHAAGIGLSILDGILRVDLARGARGSGGWRLHFRTDGVL